MTNQDHFCSYSPKSKIKIKSTVGAGDAFTAVTVMGLLDKRPLDQIIQKASDLPLFIAHIWKLYPQNKNQNKMKINHTLPFLLALILVELPKNRLPRPPMSF